MPRKKVKTDRVDPIVEEILEKEQEDTVEPSMVDEPGEPDNWSPEELRDPGDPGEATRQSGYRDGWGGEQYWPPEQPGIGTWTEYRQPKKGNH